MGFLKPKKPKPLPAPKVPTEKESAEDLSRAAEDEKQRRKYQKGRASTILSKGVQGDDSTGLATKKLLGG